MSDETCLSFPSTYRYKSIKEAGKHPPPRAKPKSSTNESGVDKKERGGGLSAMDHIHKSHLIQSNNTTDQAPAANNAMRSNCWVCCGFKEEHFVYTVPRGSPDEAIEEIAICMDFEDFIPRNMSREDTRTASSGGVCFTARRVVPPGEIRYYFLIDGVARHNPDSPSTPLDITSLIKKRRPVTSGGNSWSKVASKYTPRPRCNVRTVAHRKGFLVTRSLPRPTGLEWDGVNDLDDEEISAAGEGTGEGGPGEGGTRGASTSSSSQATPAPVSSSGGSGVSEEEESAAQKREKEKSKVKVITADKTEDIIALIWARKARYDSVQLRKGNVPMNLFEYTDSFFRTEFGVALGGPRMLAFEVGVTSNWKSSTRVRWFGTLIGWAPLRVCRDLDTPVDLDASQSYTSLLSALLPADNMEEKMVAKPCMVDFDGLLQVLDRGNQRDVDQSERKENPERVEGWGGGNDGSGADGNHDVFDAHFLATSSYQLLLGQLRRHVERTFHSAVIDIGALLLFVVCLLLLLFGSCVVFQSKEYFSRFWTMFALDSFSYS